MDFVIAVDGTAASGKGTLAARLARDLGVPHLDTGLLYRAVGWRVREAGGDPADRELAAAIAERLDGVQFDDTNLTSGLAGEDASRVATHPEVRQALYALQRRVAERLGGAVIDGRDIGTVIAPDAPAKLFVDAALETRAHRRFHQLAARGEPRSEADILADLALRDARDAGRQSAPMVVADDAVLLDTTHLDIAEAYEAARRIVEAARVRWLER